MPLKASRERFESSASTKAAPLARIESKGWKSAWTPTSAEAEDGEDDRDDREATNVAGQARGHGRQLAPPAGPVIRLAGLRKPKNDPTRPPMTWANCEMLLTVPGVTLAAMALKTSRPR